MSSEKIVHFYSGSIVDVETLQGMLEENGVSTLVRDQFSEGIRAGFASGVPSEIDLYVMEKDLDVAQGVLKNFKEQF